MRIVSPPRSVLIWRFRAVVVGILRIVSPPRSVPTWRLRAVVVGILRIVSLQKSVPTWRLRPVVVSDHEDCEPGEECPDLAVQTWWWGP